MSEEKFDVLRQQGVREELIAGIKRYSSDAPVPEELLPRIPVPEYHYYGKEVLEKAISAILCGKNLLLTGPKATGKNVLAENLSYLFGRPQWDVSFHIGVDASYLIGTDTYDGRAVTFRPGPITLCAREGGFGVLDEINMARNEALAVLHSALDFRRVIDIPGYERIPVSQKTRFLATMNYGYAGTRDLNEALTSRFAVLEMPVIGEDNLKRLIMDKFPDFKPVIRDQFVRLFFELNRKAENAEISDRAPDLRGLLDAIQLIRAGVTSGDALAMCITDKTFDAYERSLITDVIRSRIPTDLTSTDVFGA